jgi:hypothetical protein
MHVYTRINGKRRAVPTPRDLMNLPAEGQTVFLEGDPEGKDSALWAVAVLHFVKRGGTAVGR